MKSPANILKIIRMWIFIGILLVSIFATPLILGNPRLGINQIINNNQGGDDIIKHDFQIKNDEKSIDELSISIEYPDSQEIILSNRNSSHFSMETSKEETRKWHGLVHNDINYLTNIWYTEGNTILGKNNIVDTILTPVDVTINYDSGAKETMFMPDNLDSMIFEFQSNNSETLSLFPTFAMRIEYFSGSDINDYSLIIDGDTILVKTPSSKYIAFITDGSSFSNTPRMVNREFLRDDIRNDGSNTENLYTPGDFLVNSNLIISSIGIGQSIEQAKEIANYTLANYVDLKLEKKIRLSNLVSEQVFNSDIIPDINLNEMYSWLLISTDKLKMKRFGEGLYAGYHWFDDYWGRDTFISFKGGLLAIGEWEMARNTLHTMATKQQNDSSVPSTYGRVPNRVTTDTGNDDYSTADGTGWFVKSITDYVQLTNDLIFAQEILPNVELAIEGEETRIDNLGFVTHEERETWMDAQTGSVIQTPRGTRAVEIQALLYQMYFAYKNLLILLNPDNELIADINLKIESLLENIKTYYWNELGRTLYDHLDLDGFQDQDKRPNQFLALSLLPDDFLSERDLLRLIGNNLDLISDIGVRTLSSKDPNYKELHDSNEYHHDAAYHNGDIWPWLSGAAIELLLQTGYTDKVIKLLETLFIHTMTKNPMGGIGEIFDGGALGNGESVGAVLQLWSMAELIRTLTYTLTGFETDLARSLVKFNPQALKLSNYFIKNIPFIDNNLLFQLTNTDNQLTISIDDVPENFEVELVIPKKFINQNIVVSPSIANLTRNINYTLDEELVTLKGSINYVITVTNTSTIDTSSEDPINSNNNSSGNKFWLSSIFSLITFGFLRNYRRRKKNNKLF